MKFTASRRTSLTLLTLDLATAGASQAEGTDWRPFLSVTPVYQGEGILTAAATTPHRTQLCAWEFWVTSAAATVPA